MYIYKRHPPGFDNFFGVLNPQRGVLILSRRPKFVDSPAEISPKVEYFRGEVFFFLRSSGWAHLWSRLIELVQPFELGNFEVIEVVETLNLQPQDLELQPQNLILMPQTLNLKPSALSHKPSASAPRPSATNPQPRTLNPQPHTLSLKPSTLSLNP